MNTVATYTPQQCLHLFKKLFPNGLSGKDLMEALAPSGWADSPLRFHHHPTREQAYNDYLQGREWLQAHFRDLPEKTRQKVAAHYQSYEKRPFEYSLIPDEPREELKEIVGRCTWDIFSRNNVVCKKNKVYELGSFRGSAEFIDLFDRPQGLGRHYTTYYMGSVWIKDYVDLSVVYELLFSRLKAQGCLWIYQLAEPTRTDLANTQAANYAHQREAMHPKEDILPEQLPAIINAFHQVYGYLPYGLERD